MTLLVEAGAGLLRYRRLGEAAAQSCAPDAWQAPFAALAPAPRRVVVASIAGPAFAARLREWALKHWRLEPEFPVAARAALGVTNAYLRPTALGIDRWLGLLAAWHATPAPLLVVTAATAFSVDALDATGRHRGGCVMPGVRVMREALHAQTSGVAAAALLDPAAVEGVFGVNTAGAVQQGARLALAALVDRVAAALEAEVGRAPVAYLTGAGAEPLVPLVTRPLELAPDLVLRGLALSLATGAR